jgi:hypothetical protein
LELLVLTPIKLHCSISSETEISKCPPIASIYNTGSTEGQYAKTVDKDGRGIGTGKGKGRRVTSHWRQTAGNRSIGLLMPKLGDRRGG